MSDQLLKPERWATKFGVIAAVAGSAVGLGNFLRFPGKAAAYGGGAFMIPYFISLLVLGIPICWVEWTMGRYGGRHGHSSCPGILSVIWRNPVSKYLGALGLLIPVVIYMYYVYIESWCLGYAWYYLTGALMKGTDASPYGEFLDNFVGIKQDGFVLARGLQPSVIFWVIAFVINFVLIFRGVTRGIERFCTIAMPLLILCALCVLARVLTLGTPNPDLPERNVLNGLGFMWNPKPVGDQAWWQALANPTMWLEAAGQIFFSLSVGFGIVLTYASYLRGSDDVVLSGLSASTTNEFCEVCLGGLITIPAAFIFLGPGAEVTQTFALGFHTTPVVFAHMPIGRLFGFLWFFMLFLAAITSSLSMLQPAIAFFEEGFGLNRKGSVAFLSIITGLGSLMVVYFSKDLMALDTMDFWVGQVCIFILATVQVVLFGWVFGVDRGLQEAHRGADLRIPRFFRYVIKYVSPTYLLIIFVLFVWHYVPKYARTLSGNHVAALTLLVLVLLLLLFGVLIRLASVRWKLQGRGQREGA